GARPAVTAPTIMVALRRPGHGLRLPERATGKPPRTRPPGRSGCAVDLSRHDEAAIEGRASFRPVVVDVEGDRDGDGFAGPQRHLPAFRVELDPAGRQLHAEIPVVQRTFSLHRHHIASITVVRDGEEVVKVVLGSGLEAVDDFGLATRTGRQANLRDLRPALGLRLVPLDPHTVRVVLVEPIVDDLHRMNMALSYVELLEVILAIVNIIALALDVDVGIPVIAG